ncbi:hypothetical protein CCUS01_03517 [Colletotrichum cuscutae]|uniref:Uncharacterized protein n=1 Tax=Colletotrichum cuscutae TaxID=1209917 RepID=A0AAI9Y7I9_9PEZI|nr:hypothetical protein CCUS01_03517 [Colletotrichum cuscutae]
MRNDVRRMLSTQMQTSLNLPSCRLDPDDASELAFEKEWREMEENGGDWSRWGERQGLPPVGGHTLNNSLIQPSPLGSGSEGTPSQAESYVRVSLRRLNAGEILVVYHSCLSQTSRQAKKFLPQHLSSRLSAKPGYLVEGSQATHATRTSTFPEGSLMAQLAEQEGHTHDTYIPLHHDQLNGFPMRPNEGSKMRNASLLMEEVGMARARFNTPIPKESPDTTTTRSHLDEDTSVQVGVPGQHARRVSRTVPPHPSLPYVKTFSIHEPTFALEEICYVDSHAGAERARQGTWGRNHAVGLRSGMRRGVEDQEKHVRWLNLASVPYGDIHRGPEKCGKIGREGASQEGGHRTFPSFHLQYLGEQTEGAQVPSSHLPHITHPVPSSTDALDPLQPCGNRISLTPPSFLGHRQSLPFSIDEDPCSLL